jgi:pimeloyl-ACP methyl ester carboxylesterase
MTTSIEVRRHGSAGPEVVVLHGGPGAPGTALSLARALAPRFRVFEPLQRRGGDGALTVARHVEDLADVAPGRAHVVGHSWGAMLALSFAAAHPGRVRSLSLVGCGTYDEVARAEFRRRTDERLGPEGRARVAALRERLAQTIDPVERDRTLAEMGALFDGTQGVDVVPDDDDTAIPPDAAGHEETWKDVLRLQAEGIEPKAFAVVTAPARMFHGADDPHPGPMIRDALARHVPHLDYVEFPRCGHSPWLERAAREPFLASLTAWLARHGFPRHWVP